MEEFFKTVRRYPMLWSILKDYERCTEDYPGAGIEWSIELALEVLTSGLLAMKDQR